MNSMGGTKPNMSKNFCIRDYVAQVQNLDWRKCCPFNLSGGSEESNRRAEVVYASMFLENKDYLVNNQEHTKAPHCSIEVNSVKKAHRPSEERINKHATPSRNDKKRGNHVVSTPHKFRMLSGIYKEVDASIDDESPGDDHDRSSDDVTLGTFVRDIKRKGVESRILKGKSVKPVSKESHGTSSKRKELGASSDDKESDPSTETTLLREKQAVGCISEGSRAYRGKKKTPRAAVPRFAGAKRRKPEANNTAASEKNAVLRASGFVQKRTRESSPLFDDEMMAAAQFLLDMSNGRVGTNALSKTATEEQAVVSAKAKGNVVCVLDGYELPAVGSGLCHDKQTEYETFVCAINQNPSDFATLEAKKFMRRG